MGKAREDSDAANYKSEIADRNSNSDRWSAIWYEAYQNHRSKARVEAQYKKEEQFILKSEVKINDLTVTIKTLKMNVDIAKGKLSQGLEVMKDAEVQLDI